MKPGLSLQIIILALLKMECLQRLAINFACPVVLYLFICNSKQIKQLLWTKLASKANSQGRPQCQLEALELSDVGRKCPITMDLMIGSTPTLRSLSVHSREYIYSLWAFIQVRRFTNLTSFTFSSVDESVAPHTLRDILNLCPAIIALHLPTPLQWAFLLSPDALPKQNTLDVSSNTFVLAFLEGRPVRRLFTNHMHLSNGLQSLHNCSFSLLHVGIEYSYAEEYIDDLNRTLMYCEDLALDVWIGGQTVRHSLTSSVSISRLLISNSAECWSSDSVAHVANCTESCGSFAEDKRQLLMGRAQHGRVAASLREIQRVFWQVCISILRVAWRGR